MCNREMTIPPHCLDSKARSAAGPIPDAKDLRDLKESQAQLVANYNHLVELSHVLQARHARGGGEARDERRVHGARAQELWLAMRAHTCASS